MPVTFPELPVSYDCSPDSFAEITHISKCGNMDAYKIDIIKNGELQTIYFTGITIMEAVDKFNIPLLNP